MARAELSFTRDEVCRGEATYEALGIAALEADRFHEVMDDVPVHVELPHDPDYYGRLVDQLDERLRAETGNEDAGVNLVVLTRKCPLRTHEAKPLPSKDNLGFDEVAKFVVVLDPDVPEFEDVPTENLPTILLHDISKAMVRLGPRRFIKSFRGGSTLPVRIGLSGSEEYVFRRFAPTPDILTPDDMSILSEDP